MADRARVWDAASRQEWLRRGFDDTRAWLPHCALPTPPEPRLGRQVVEEDVRGTFAAIGALAGWWCRQMPCDPASENTRECAGVIAQELEEMAGELRNALNDYERTAG
jgi:hypothetical protein